jgi:hypothetical protein
MYGPDAEETEFFPEQETPVNWRVYINKERAGGLSHHTETALKTNDIRPRDATHLTQSKPAHQNRKTGKHYIRHVHVKPAQFHNREIDNISCKRMAK